MWKTIVAGLASGLIGGIVGAYLFAVNRDQSTPAAGAATRHAREISAAKIELVDARGKVRAALALSGDGGPALFFFDSAGKNRLVLGLSSKAEGEAPSVVLNDAEQRAAGIFRLFGARDTPVVVLKSQGRDRSIYGLNATSTEPFLENYAGDGKKSDVFGNF
jgi:hypothetical protein